MQEDTKPQNDDIQDAQPKDDDIQDEERKKPFSRSEYHGVITSYAGLALSLIAIILSVITMYQSHMMETREIVQILRVEDDGYYHFDGEKLFKNFQVTVANNSAIPVSVVEITIERDGEARTFEISDLPDILPLNMESNQTEMITIPWDIEFSEENAQTIRECIEETEFPIAVSSRTPDSSRTPKLKDELEQTILWVYREYKRSEYKNYMSLKSLKSILPNSLALGFAVGQVEYEEGNPKVLPLSVALNTAKNNQCLFITTDMGPPESAIREDTWVTEHMISSDITNFILKYEESSSEIDGTSSATKEE